MDDKHNQNLQYSGAIPEITVTRASPIMTMSDGFEDSSSYETLGLESRDNSSNDTDALKADSIEELNFSSTIFGSQELQNDAEKRRRNQPSSCQTIADFVMSPEFKNAVEYHRNLSSSSNNGNESQTRIKKMHTNINKKKSVRYVDQKLITIHRSR